MTIAVDTSAVVAVTFEEQTAPWLATRLESASDRLTSTASAVELGLVLAGRSYVTMSAFDVIAAFGIELVPLNLQHAEVAVDAWRSFRWGRHRARLNLGDCYSYALARIAAVPLLCVGDDFRQTDLDVLAPPRSA